MHRSLALTLALLALGTAACDDDPPKPDAGASASASAAAAATPAPAATLPPKPKTMPELTVDSEGPFLNGTRINLADATGPDKLTRIVKDLPINDQPVTLLVDKKAKIPAVAAVVTALGEAGAPKVLIKTDGRDDLPKEISVTPESRVSAPASCSVATMVTKDLATAIWSIKGDRAKLQRKGLAGPDLSRTGEQLTKDIAACTSTVAFFSGDEGLLWESAFNLAGTVLKADEKKKIDTLVLLREIPVAGRPVALGKH